MQRDRELDGTEIRSEMATVVVHRVDDQLANLVGEIVKLLEGAAAKVVRPAEGVEQHHPEGYRSTRQEPGQAGCNLQADTEGDHAADGIKPEVSSP